MYNIFLVCSAGMSTSLLVMKMTAAAKERGVEAKIAAVAEAELSKVIDSADIVLLGPQVRYLLGKIKDLLAAKGTPVEVINSIDYGTMNGDKVLQRALELIGK
ncbi:PTS sugar transporter subunit IIB [Propionispora vibrioides]|jgi:PTS system cellobiose-specific IIB component|uniref:PTS system, cellobiose-specific IIB component n=1 Tax=Propionispora vibrioides TaxID=112903 RepID=A0A1H8Y6Y0_9FIRM|nr:PTS sugar transporter subunit IIB [Propionispora vibrioides]SEP47761.1 PTS system, cellobiose-specific IIB component [Propionispora vibrioides]